MKPGVLLRIEGAVLLFVCCAAYGLQSFSWLWFALLLLTPDVSMLGYLAGPKVGASAYNLAHTYAISLILTVIGITTAHAWVAMYGLIWTAHIGLDRMLGFGLKYPTNFKDTHLQRLALLFALTVGVPRTAAAQWPIKTREHVDLWLTGFAELDDDTTAKVPVFRRAFLDEIAVAQNQRGVLTSLDSIHDRLVLRMDESKNLRNARTLALDAGTWDEMAAAIQRYLTPEKERKKEKNALVPDVENHLSDFFTTPGDREWLGEFGAGLDGARTEFFHTYWVAEQLKRRPILAATDSLWRRVYGTKMRRFLVSTRQPQGDIIMSLPVDGAGVMFKAANNYPIIAVPFPDSVADAAQPIYVFAHEVARAVTTDAIAAGTTALERRNGIGEKYAEAVAVQGGYALLQKTAPDLANGYARYYGRSSPIEVAFPLPDAVRDAVNHQIDRALSF